MEQLATLLRQLSAVERKKKALAAEDKRIRDAIAEVVGLGFEMPAKMGPSRYLLARYSRVKAERWSIPLLEKFASPALRAKARVTSEYPTLKILEIDEDQYSEYI